MLTVNLPMIGPVCDLREIVLTYSGRSPGEPSLRRRLGESPHYVWRISHESPNPRIRGRSTALSRRTRGRLTALLPRSPVLPGPCACPPALAASTRAACMSACTRLACPGRAHVYLGHVPVRPGQPPRARGYSCLLRPAAQGPRPIIDSIRDHREIGLIYRRQTPKGKDVPDAQTLPWRRAAVQPT